jgi:hypothetical protein
MAAVGAGSAFTQIQPRRNLRPALWLSLSDRTGRAGTGKPGSSIIATVIAVIAVIAETRAQRTAFLSSLVHK